MEALTVVFERYNYLVKTINVGYMWIKIKDKKIKIKGEDHTHIFLAHCPPKSSSSSTHIFCPKKLSIHIYIYIYWESAALGMLAAVCTLDPWTLQLRSYRLNASHGVGMGTATLFTRANP